MLSCFSSVWLCANPWIAAHKAPPSTGFSKQEYWSGLPFLSPKYFSKILVKNILKTVIYLSGCTMSYLWFSVSLVLACEVLVVPCTIEILDHGSNPGPLLWDLGVLTTGTPGKSLIDLFYCLFSLSFIYFHTDFIISFISDSGLCLFLFF